MRSRRWLGFLHYVRIVQRYCIATATTAIWKCGVFEKAEVRKKEKLCAICAREYACMLACLSVCVPRRG